MSSQVPVVCANFLSFSRYQSLHEPLQIRRDNLEDAMLLYQFLRDVDDELTWIQEKEPIASSTDLGTSLSAVQKLQKKHQTLEAEIQSHEPVISTVVSRGLQMVKSGHFALQQVRLGFSVYEGCFEKFHLIFLSAFQGGRKFASIAITDNSFER